jgi:hypothetical protein
MDILQLPAQTTHQNYNRHHHCPLRDYHHSEHVSPKKRTCIFGIIQYSPLFPTMSGIHPAL